MLFIFCNDFRITVVSAIVILIFVKSRDPGVIRKLYRREFVAKINDIFKNIIFHLYFAKITIYDIYDIAIYLM